MIDVFLANGFEELEALATVDLLRRAELEVTIVGVGGKQITGSHGIVVTTDITEKEVTTDPLEAVVLPGGMPGTLHLEHSPIVKACVQYCVDNDLLLAAICAAPSILGHMGLLKGRSAVCFPGYEEELLGARVLQESVCVDGKLITAKGAGVTIEFALAIVDQLCGKARAEKIRQSIQCR